MHDTSNARQHGSPAIKMWNEAIRKNKNKKQHVNSIECNKPSNVILQRRHPSSSYNNNHTAFYNNENKYIFIIIISIIIAINTKL